MSSLSFNKKERLLPTIFLKEEVIGKRLSSSMQLPKKNRQKPLPMLNFLALLGWETKVFLL